MVRILKSTRRAAGIEIWIVVFLLLHAVLSWSLVVEARRSSQFEVENPLTGQQQAQGRDEEPAQQSPTSSSGKHKESWPLFREAPAFRNGNQCVSVNRRKSDHAEDVCDSSSVHIAMTLDVAYLRGSMAAVFSILKHTGCPENVIFHFLVSDRDAELRALIYSTFPFLRFKVYHFDEALVKSRISASVRLALEHPLNYARSYLADILEPCVKRVIYLDSDLIVVDDIVKLWGTRLGSHAIGAPEYCHANLTKYFTASFWNNEGLAKIFDGKRPCYFNTGVMVMDLVKWREQNYRATIEEWMESQKETRIYELGSLPLSCLCLLERWSLLTTDGINMVWVETTLKEDADLSIQVLSVYFTGVEKGSHGSDWMRESHVLWTISGLLMIFSFLLHHPILHDASGRSLDFEQ